MSQIINQSVEEKILQQTDIHVETKQNVEGYKKRDKVKMIEIPEGFTQISFYYKIIMTPLNLPKYNINVKELPDGSLQIFDRLRGKFVALTPEEWVRQHFVAF